MAFKFWEITTVGVLFLSGIGIINNKIDGLEETIKNVGIQQKNSEQRIIRQVKDLQKKRPASYSTGYSNPHIFNVDLKVKEVCNTVPGEGAKPALTGYAYFSTTPDNVGYYIFSKGENLKIGDNLEGWFSETGLSLSHPRHNKSYDLIVPVFMDEVSLVEDKLSVQ